MPAVLRRLVHDRGTAPRDLRAAVRGLDGGLVALVPHERPVEGRLPELADGARAVAAECADAAASGGEPVARCQDAEFVALGILEDDVRLGGELADVEVTSSQRQHALDRGLLVLERRAREVEVHPVPHRLGVARRLDVDRERDVVRCAERQHAVVVAVDDLATEDLRPERGQALGVVGVDHECFQSAGHVATLVRTPHGIRGPIGVYCGAWTVPSRRARSTSSTHSWPA